MNTEEGQEELLTVRYVANVLRVDDTTVVGWIKEGILDAVILPQEGRRRAYRVKQSTLDAILQTSEPARE